MLKWETSHNNLQIMWCSAYVERKLGGVYSVKTNSHRKSFHIVHLDSRLFSIDHLNFHFFQMLLQS